MYLWSLWLRTISISSDGSHTQYVLKEKRHNIYQITAKPQDWLQGQIDSGDYVFLGHSVFPLLFLSFIYSVGPIFIQVLPVFWQNDNELVSCLAGNLRGKDMPSSWYFQKCLNISLIIKISQVSNQLQWSAGVQPIPTSGSCLKVEKVLFPIGHHCLHRRKIDTEQTYITHTKSNDQF